jgi:hypothetical protein
MTAVRPVMMAAVVTKMMAAKTEILLDLNARIGI